MKLSTSYRISLGLLSSPQNLTVYWYFQNKINYVTLASIF